MITEESNPASIFLNALNKIDIKYMVTGSVASSIYGEPRLTHDVDLVVQMTSKGLERFLSQFSESNFYCPPSEVILEEVARNTRGHINVIHLDTGYKADIYFSGQDELMNWGLEHSKKINWEGIPVPVAPPEYVIVRKLEFYKEGGSHKHKRDIQLMLKVSKDMIDITLLEELVTKLNLFDVWVEVR